MLYYYYSNWILTLFILWGLGKLFSIDFIVDNIHTHQANTLVAVGFTFLLIYYLFYKGYRYEISFFIYKSLLHYLPWYITYKYSKKKYGNELLLITLLLYITYMILSNKSPFYLYFTFKHPTSWKSLFKLLRNY